MYQGFRILTDDEIEQVAGVYDGCGGMWPPEYYSTTIYVTYTAPSNPWVQSMSYATYMDYYYQDPYAQVSYAPPSGGGGGGGGASGPNTANSNEITNLSAPDGADYFVPEGVTGQYLLNAVNHVIGIANAQGKFAAFQEIGRMYTDSSSSFFVDFKRAGTGSGPSAWQDGGNISYYSNSTGQTVQADAFEPFGNFFFGYLMTFAGAAFEETKAIAALVQGEGYQQLTSMNPVLMATAVANAAYYGDDPSDRPFVDHGAYLAAQYISSPSTNGYQFGVGN